MKKFYIASLGLAFLSSAAFASGEHCVTRNISANYTGGNLQSTQCFSSESNLKASQADKCRYESK